MTDFSEAARRVLSANDRGGYTVPTPRLYPFQWNWDSAFVAMGFALFDVERAVTELEWLVRGQWADGMIPHIVFHQPSDSYFPGPDVWRTPHTPVPTSGITQPPVFAMALKAILDAARQKKVQLEPGRIARLFDAALAFHRWWYAARDPDGTGLVALLHPWESGSDNSPAWDAALARVPVTTTTPVRRKDTGHVDAAMRPRDEDYARFIHLVDLYADCGWDPVEQWRRTPFKIADVQTTAILARAGEDLAAVADSLGRTDEASEIRAMVERSRAALAGTWRDALSRFVSRDLVSREDVTAPTQASFLPLLALDLEPARRDTAEREMRGWCEGLAVAFPSTPRSSPQFEAKRYWRGPVWAVINWLLIDGLERNGLAEFAADLRQGTVAAIERAGFCEYFDPVTGEGCGGEGFSWTAAAYLHFTAMSARR